MARGQLLGLRHPVEVAHMHDLGRLIGDGPGQMRVAMADGGGGDAGAEIQESSAVRRPQPSTFTTLKSEVGTVVGGHQGGDHAGISPEGFSARGGGIAPSGRKHSTIGENLPRVKAQDARVVCELENSVRLLQARWGLAVQLKL